MRLDEAGELELLAELERRGLARGIEHDAAVVDGLVVTQDALVEGVHFRFDLLSWRELGFRAAAVNVSDLAASGAEPIALLGDTGSRRIDSLVHDVVESSARVGDIVQSPEIGGAMLALRSFMFEHVYLGPHALLEQERARATIRRIFEHLVAGGEEPEQIVDFIAGMTDRFALTYVAELA